MKAVMTSVVLLGAFASGCTFGRHSLPDEFEVRAIGTYKWFPFPFAEAGMYYDFIGIGWLVHDERTDEVALSHQGRDLAVAAHQGSDGWKLTVSGRNMVAKEGWSLGGSNSCMLAGTTRQANPQPSAQRPGRERFTPGMPHLNLPDETDYLYEWSTIEEPLLKLDDIWNSVVFLLVASDNVYIRIVGYDSSHYGCIGSSIAPGGDELPGGHFVNFTLRDRHTGKVLLGTYPCEWRKIGQVSLEVAQDTTPQ